MSLSKHWHVQSFRSLSATSRQPDQAKASVRHLAPAENPRGRNWNENRTLPIYPNQLWKGCQWGLLGDDICFSFLSIPDVTDSRKSLVDLLRFRFSDFRIYQKKILYSRPPKRIDTIFHKPLLSRDVDVDVENA